MIAVDTSVWIAYFDGEKCREAAALDDHINQCQVAMVPVVLTELLSLPGLDANVEAYLLKIEELPVLPGFWERAGKLRAAALAQGRPARLGDALIAQCCLDHDVPVLTRDRDFRAFVPHGLRLATA